MRILVVEDDPAFRDSLVRGLRQAGHAVDAAGTVVEALAKLGLEPYDAVVLDISLPDGSGLDLARTLRRGGSNVLILAATATPCPTAWPVSMPAPTTTWSNCLPSKNCWRGSGRSTGVRLTIVRWIAELHGGTLVLS